MDASAFGKVFTKNKNIVFREEMNFGLLFNIETGRIHKINHTAVVIWKSIDSRRTVADVITEVKGEYGEIDTIPADVSEFVSFLEKTQYIEEVSS